MNRFYENRNHDIYSNGELRVIKKLSTLNPLVIIDGGANIGRYSLEVDKQCSNVSVYSFEPVESTFRILENNTKDNGQITPVMKGLYSGNTKKEINIFPGISHSSIYDLKAVPFEKVDSETIELVSGDQFMAENGIDSVDLLKLDVEGAEYRALEGFKNAFHNKKIKMVQFEYGYINITTRKLLLDFYEFFESYGYITGKVFPKKVKFRPYKFKYEDFMGPNFVAVGKTDTELIELLSR